MFIPTEDQTKLTPDECDSIHAIILAMSECNDVRLNEIEDFFGVRFRKISQKVGAQASKVDPDVSKLNEFCRNHFGRIRMTRRLNKIIEVIA